MKSPHFQYHKCQYHFVFADADNTILPKETRYTSSHHGARARHGSGRGRKDLYKRTNRNANILIWKEISLTPSNPNQSLFRPASAAKVVKNGHPETFCRCICSKHLYRYYQYFQKRRIFVW